jgi:eukaryotic-like serine/threonine-protein kinase
MAAPSSETRIVAQKYELVREIGRGGMGAIYEGRNRTTLKRCAVKLLSSEVAASEEMVRRFFREAQASSVVESEHVVQVFDSGFDGDNGHPYLVMELLSGEDLEHVLLRLGALEPNAAARVAFQAATGLAKAHSQGVVHRDIKPGNLFLSKRDSGEHLVKILDFGIAKVRMQVLHDSVGGLTRTGSILGTPYYMSPEQSRGLPTIDARSDVWSLGVVLFEMLTGRVPFADAQTLGDLMVAIITTKVPMVQDLAPWVPAELAELVHTALSRDLNVRYADAGVMRDALARFVRDGGRLTPELLVAPSATLKAQHADRVSAADHRVIRASDQPPALAATAPTTERGGKPRRRGVFVLSALLVAGAAVGGGAVLMRPAPGASQPERLPSSSEPAPSAATAAPNAPLVLPQQDIRRFELLVTPQASVEVDGTARPNANGRVIIEAPLGSTHAIVVTLDRARKVETVVVSEQGLVPSRIELEPASEAPVSKRPRTPGEKRAAAEPEAARTGQKPGAPKSTPSDAKKAVRLNESTSEFE